MSRRTVLRACLVGVASIVLIAIMTVASHVALAAGGTKSGGDRSGGDHGNRGDHHDHRGSHANTQAQPPEDIPSQALLRQNPRSQVYMLSANSDGCVSFVNMSARTVSGVTVWVTALDAGGKVVEASAALNGGTELPGAQSDVRFCQQRYNHVLPGGAPVEYIATPVEVRYADGTTWDAGPDVLGSASATGNPDIAIVKTFAWEPDGECAAFTVTGTQPIKHVQLAFSHPRSNKPGVDVEVIDIKGDYEPGSTHTGCINWKGDESPIPGALPGATIHGIWLNAWATTVVSAIRRVDYQDGTVWLAPKTPDVPTPVPTPVATPAADYDIWWTANGPDSFPVGFAQPATSSITITGASATTSGSDDRENDECVNALVNSPIPVTHVHVVFSHIGADGSKLADRAVDVVTKKNHPDVAGSHISSCYVSDASWVRGTLPQLDGWTAAPPGKTYNVGGLNFSLPVQWSGGGTKWQAIYDGKLLGTIGVAITEVDFADGTSWHDTR